MSHIRVAAVGDIAFVGRLNTNTSLTPFENVRSVFQNHDLVIGNLESALTTIDQINFSKCSLQSNPTWAKNIKHSGINVLSLANNHIMDFGAQGLIDSLDKAGIMHVGAGIDSRQALQPLYLNLQNKKIAILARSEVEVKSQCYAEEDTPGVAKLELNETLDMIGECKKVSDHVILSLHWGLEHYSYPSQSQRNTAMALIHAGVDILIGHHPHVLQGIDQESGGLVVYSLGNFIFDDFSWNYTDINGNKSEQKVSLNNEQRETAIVSADLSHSGCSRYDVIPVYIQSNSEIVFQKDKFRLKQLRRLNLPFRFPLYSLFWKLYAVKKEFYLRLLPQVSTNLKISKIKKIRMRHFVEIFKIIKRSASIANEKKTNPYD
ncbi:MAG: CapA family protein [Candidatus Thiodiazotropha weberae]|nr:CapA family protein [Candidatus Thiodiazotropha lotti]MCW4208796.1 CapA family protein [Candidatus Thiodiazotropha lotti]